MSVTLEDVRHAADAIGSHIVRTPLLHSATLSRLTGCELYIKFENHQFTAAFKERGALNHLLARQVIGVDAELENDHFSATLYTSDNGEDEAALARLFDTYGLDPFVELAPAKVLYDRLDAGEWHRLRSEAFNDLGLEPMRPEHEIEVMLTLHRQLTIQD